MEQQTFRSDSLLLEMTDIILNYFEKVKIVIRKIYFFSFSNTFKSEFIKEVDSSKLNQTLDNPLWLIYVLSVPILFAIILTILPSVYDENKLTTEIALASLGYFAVVLSFVMISSLTIVGMLLGLLYPVDVKGTLNYLSTCIGVGGVAGFMSAAMTPMRFMADIGTGSFSSDLFDGSVLLKLPAAFGVLGLLVGLCTGSCHLVAGSGGVKRKYIFPTMLFITVIIIFWIYKGDPFSLGLGMSEKFLKQNSHIVYCIESAQGVERESLIRENISISVAEYFLEYKNDLFSYRWWSLLVIGVTSCVGAFLKNRAERNAEVYRRPT